MKPIKLPFGKKKDEPQADDEYVTLDTAELKKIHPTLADLVDDQPEPDAGQPADQATKTVGVVPSRTASETPQDLTKKIDVLDAHIEQLAAQKPAADPAAAVAPQTEQDEPLEDDEEYEYVTPHYTAYGVLTGLIAMAIGALVVFFLSRNALSASIRQGYIDKGYVMTKDAIATSQDIVSGKTAYVNGQLVTGTYVDIDTSMATAAASDILAGKTAYVNGVKVTGTMPSFVGTNYSASQIGAGTATVKVVAGTYISGDIILPGSATLLDKNIREGVTIFGVTGTYVAKQP